MTLSPGLSAVATLAGMAAVFVWRIREGRTAVTIRKILIPPLGMATGFCMFAVPGFRVPWMWAVPAFLIGAVALAYPLLLTSRLVRQGDVVMMERSNAFFAVILGLAAIRLLARGYFDTNTGDHQHFFLEDEGTLIDIPGESITVAGVPTVPPGLSVDRVDVVVQAAAANPSLPRAALAMWQLIQR